MTIQQESRFWDRTAAKYAQQPVADEASYQKKLQVTRGYLKRDMAVLEFGCGTGSTAIAHAPYVRHIHAIDISQNMLRIAQHKADAAKIRNITFEQAAIEDFPAADRSFDVALGLSILHLVDDRDAVIARVHRLLKPGGIFVSSTACLGDGMPFLKFVAPLGHALGVIPRLRIFTAAELERSLTGAGFAIDYRWQPDPAKAVFIIAKKAV